MKTSQTRMTKQRRVILDELRKVVTHPTAEELYGMVRKRIPRVSLGTVYRNLDFLTASGEVQQINSGGVTRRFDGNSMPHPHVRCMRCGKVGDVMLTDGMGWPPALVTPGLASADGFSVMGGRLEFDGYCSHCLEQVQEPDFDRDNTELAAGGTPARSGNACVGEAV